MFSSLQQPEEMRFSFSQDFIRRSSFGVADPGLLALDNVLTRPEVISAVYECIKSQFTAPAGRLETEGQCKRRCTAAAEETRALCWGIWAATGSMFESPAAPVAAAYDGYKASKCSDYYTRKEVQCIKDCEFPFPEPRCDRPCELGECCCGVNCYPSQSKCCPDGSSCINQLECCRERSPSGGWRYGCCCDKEPCLPGTIMDPGTCMTGAAGCSHDPSGPESAVR
jgi:hypothetical protein